MKPDKRNTRPGKFKRKLVPVAVTPAVKAKPKFSLRAFATERLPTAVSVLIFTAATAAIVGAAVYSPPFSGVAMADGEPYVVLAHAVIGYGEPLPRFSDAEYEVLTEVDTAVVGDTVLELKIDRRTYFSTLSVVDAVAPVAVTRDRVIIMGERPDPFDFLESVSDYSGDVTATFDGETSERFSTPGTHSLDIVVTDAYGNALTVSASVTVLRGTFYLRGDIGDEIALDSFVFDEAPGAKLVNREYKDFALPGRYRLYIALDGREVPVTLEMFDVTPPTFDGVRDQNVRVGGTVSYREGVTASDNVDGENIPFDVDASAVDLNTPGKYETVYTVVDAAGNATSATAYVTVLKKNAPAPKPAANLRATAEITPEYMDGVADEILASLNLSGLSSDQKVLAIYKFVKSRLSYVHDTENREVYLASYYALKNGRADCYSHYALSELLLKRAGFQTVRIQRSGGRSNHYWNLIYTTSDSTGVTGWYHFDTTPFSTAKADQHLFTEKRAQELTELRGFNCYVYEASLYPEVVWE